MGDAVRHDSSSYGKCDRGVEASSCEPVEVLAGILRLCDSLP